jgi:hypothetical protein
LSDIFGENISEKNLAVAHRFIIRVFMHLLILLSDDEGELASGQDPSGLQYFNARYYDSSVGQFTSADSAQGPNRYAYVDGNPETYIDPTGEVALRSGLLPEGLVRAFAKVPLSEHGRHGSRGGSSGNPTSQPFTAGGPTWRDMIWQWEVKIGGGISFWVGLGPIEPGSYGIHFNLEIGEQMKKNFDRFFNYHFYYNGFGAWSSTLIDPAPADLKGKEDEYNTGFTNADMNYVVLYKAAEFAANSLVPFTIGEEVGSEISQGAGVGVAIAQSFSEGLHDQWLAAALFVLAFAQKTGSPAGAPEIAPFIGTIAVVSAAYFIVSAIETWITTNQGGIWGGNIGGENGGYAPPECGETGYGLKCD